MATAGTVHSGPASSTGKYTFSLISIHQIAKVTRFDDQVFETHPVVCGLLFKYSLNTAM